LIDEKTGCVIGLSRPAVPIFTHFVGSFPLSIEDSIQSIHLCCLEREFCGAGALGISLGFHSLQLLFKTLDVLAEDPDDGGDIIPGIGRTVGNGIRGDDRGLVREPLDWNTDASLTVIASLARPFLAGDQTASTVRGNPKSRGEFVVGKPAGVGHVVRPDIGEDATPDDGSDVGADDALTELRAG
jgi:hypothetical protein